MMVACMKLGGGSYVFQEDVVGPVLLALTNDEILSNGEKGLGICFDGYR